MNQDQTLNGVELGSYRRALGPLLFSYILDGLVTLLAVALLLSAFQREDYVFVALMGLILAFSARTLTRRTRDVQLALQGPAVQVYTDGLYVNAHPEARSLRWDEVAGASVHKLGSFGRIDIKTHDEAAAIQVHFIRTPDALGRQISDLRQGG
jgi:hypothetical protein